MGDAWSEPGGHATPPPIWPPPPGHAPPPPSGWDWAPPPLPKGGSARTGPLPLHPMTISDVLDGAFKLMKANARTVLSIAAVFVVPVQLAVAFLQRDLLGGQGLIEAFRDPSVTARDGSTAADDVATVLALVSTVLVLPFVAGAVSRVVAASYLGDELGPGPALRAVGRRWWSLTASWVLVHVAEVGLWILAVLVIVAAVLAGAGDAGLVAAIPLALAGVPWFLAMMTLFVPVAPAVVVEELGPVQAMRRSAGLVRRRFWGVLGIALLGGLLANILGQVLGVVPQVAGLLVGTGRGGWILIAAGGILTSLVTTPLVAIISTLVYFDGRIRHEGFDLQIIAADLARGAADA